MNFVFFFAAFVGLAAFFISRRLMYGPDWIRLNWILAIPRVAPTATDYRTATTPTLGDLVRALEQVGYQAEYSQVDEFGAALWSNQK